MAEVIEPADEGRAGIYEFRSTFADKWLLPDGSVLTAGGALVEGPDEHRAEAYTYRRAIPAKFLLPDGSIVFALPGGSGGTLDHNLLIHRDAPDQHPVEAITGLSEKLGKVTDQNGTDRAVWIGVYDDLPGTLDPATMYFVTEG